MFDKNPAQIAAEIFVEHLDEIDLDSEKVLETKELGRMFIEHQSEYYKTNLAKLEKGVILDNSRGEAFIKHEHARCEAQDSAEHHDILASVITICDIFHS